MPVSVWTSTLRRTIQTAEHLPFPKLRWKVHVLLTVKLLLHISYRCDATLLLHCVSQLTQSSGCVIMLILLQLWCLM